LGRASATANQWHRISADKAVLVWLICIDLMVRFLPSDGLG